MGGTGGRVAVFFGVFFAPKKTKQLVFPSILPTSVFFRGEKISLSKVQNAVEKKRLQFFSQPAAGTI